ncbi:MAG TPA: hypothetical protein VKA32_02735 [Gammaproteobacteria bacterium]|nr:hypothetical protein [Gammaproteobacteria bacterium]
MLSGLAVGVMARSTLTPGMTVLGPDSGMPAIGDIQLELLRRDGSGNTLVETLCDHIVDAFHNRNGLTAAPWRLTG